MQDMEQYSEMERTGNTEASRKHEIENNHHVRDMAFVTWRKDLN